MRTIRIVTDFSDTPLGRYEEDGEYNGTAFREKLLRPALDANDEVRVELDGVEGYGSSFLEEAFGGLVREGYFTKDQIKKRLKIVTADPDYEIYESLIWKYIAEARPANQDA